MEQFVGEEIGNHRRPPGELGHRGRDVGAIVEPSGGQPQASHPALGLTPQPLDLTGSQAVLAERVEQLGGLGQRQREVALADLGEPAPAPPPADRQLRVDPAGQQHPRAFGEVLDDEAEILGDLRALQVVYVLEHDDERIGDGRPGGEQAVEKARRQPVHVRCRLRELREGARDRAPQAQGQRDPEALRPVVVGVECHPFPADRVQGPEPLRHRYGLPGGGPAGHQRDPPVGLGQDLGQAPPGNRPDRYRRAPELRTWHRKRAARGDGPRAPTTHMRPAITPGSEVLGPKVPSCVWPGLRTRVIPAGARPAYPERVWATHPVRRFPVGIGDKEV